LRVLASGQERRLLAEFGRLYAPRVVSDFIPILNRQGKLATLEALQSVSR
jgi:hypothetical protein